MSAKPLFRPLGNRVYVRREVAAKTTAGGLHIPDTALRPATDRGTVVAVGPGGVGAHGKHVAVSVDVGDEVLFNRQAIELDVPMDDGNNEKLVIVQEHELLGYRAVKPAAKRVNITAHGASPEAIADAVTQKAATQRLSQKESV